jgi:hypothetical protein
MIGGGGKAMRCHLCRPGPFWGVGGGEEMRKGIAGSCQWPIKFNEIDYLYLSSLAGEHGQKGLTKQGKALSNVVSSTIQYSQLAEVGRWSVRTTKLVLCLVG